MTDRYFTRETLAFLRELAQHNNREWFESNKDRYESHVREPALDLITHMADDLAALSPHFLAQAKKLGGSLMRVHRDIRFTRDKTPYKTNIGIQYRHERGRDVHAPGFYIHISPAESFLGVGIWRPEARALARVRDALVAQDGKWLAVRDETQFAREYVLSGDSLLRPPRGYAADHPLIADLKRKDFIAISPLRQQEVLGSRFKELAMQRFRLADGFMRFLCAALNLQY